MKKSSLRSVLTVVGVSCLLLGAMGLVAQHGRIALNVTPSLPDSIYWIDRGEKSAVAGDLIAFESRAMPPIPDGVTVVKIVRGIAGDVITVIDRAVYVNGRFIGLAKTRSSTGQPLNVITSQTIPEGKVFVWAPHPDSFDSRYETPGLIDTGSIIGRARALF